MLVLKSELPAPKIPPPKMLAAGCCCCCAGSGFLSDCLGAPKSGCDVGPKRLEEVPKSEPDENDGAPKVRSEGNKVDGAGFSVFSVGFGSFCGVAVKSFLFAISSLDSTFELKIFDASLSYFV